MDSLTPGGQVNPPPIPPHCMLVGKLTSRGEDKQEGPGSFTWEWLFIKVKESIDLQDSYNILNLDSVVQ